MANKIMSDNRKNEILLRITRLIAQLVDDEEDEILVNMLDRISQHNPSFQANGEHFVINKAKYRSYLDRKQHKLKCHYTPSLPDKYADAFLRVLLLANGDLTILDRISGVSTGYLVKICNGSISEIPYDFAYKLCKSVHFEVKPYELCASYTQQQYEEEMERAKNLCKFYPHFDD